MDIASHFNLLDTQTNFTETNFIEWIRGAQQDAQEVIISFQEHGLSGDPESFLSDRLGYIRHGCSKSLIKFLDEYYWLRIGDKLPIPPRWTPHNI